MSLSINYPQRLRYDLRALLLVVVLAVSAIGIMAVTAPKAAAMPAGWKAGRIIDDSVFTANTSMTAAQIQSFLAGKVPSCDTYGQQISEFGGPDLNGDGRVQRWEWGKSKYNQTIFTCLKDYTQNGKRASQILYEVSQKYHISPKVLIVLLQKEQSLVTDTWPLNIQYKTATGYGCPDTAPCDSQYYGLTNQLDWAAKMFRAIMDDSPTWYTPYELGANYIQYNPSSSCGGSTVIIENRSTQALYNYTPYQPNRAALDAGWGSAPCGAYGNRNFFLYFSSWFGQPNSAATYGYTTVSSGIYSDAGYTTKIGTSAADIRPGASLYAQIVIKNTGNQVWYKEFLRLGTTKPTNRISQFANSTWLSGARPASSVEDAVSPNATATFRFKLTAPNEIGVFKEYFGPLLERQRWLGDNIALTLNVSSPDPLYLAKATTFNLYRDSYKYRQSTNIVTYPGSRIFAKVSLKNIGNRSWPATLTKLAPTGPRDQPSAYQEQGWLSPTRIAAANEGEIKPGETGTFMFSFSIPEDSAIGPLSQRIGLVIEGQRWVSDEVVKLSGAIKERPPNRLSIGQSIAENQSLISSDERFQLILQTDGNLVLYSIDSGKPLWWSQTYGSKANHLVLQNDGNLVLYSDSGKPLWWSQTYGSKANHLVLQNDGNLVLYSDSGKPLWWSGAN